MKKILLLFCLFFALGCNPSGPYVPQTWYEDTIYVDTAVINQIDNAESMDEMFPPEWYEDVEDPGCY